VKKVFQVLNGEFVEVTAASSGEGPAPFVHPDTLKAGLRHPVTGEITESVSRYNQINKKLGLEVVGNDLLSQKPRRFTDKVDDKRVLDAIYKAESIYSDPTKYRARQNENMERLERYRRLIGENR